MSVEELVKMFMRADFRPLFLWKSRHARRRDALQYAAQLGYTEADFHREVMRQSGGIEL